VVIDTENKTVLRDLQPDRIETNQPRVIAGLESHYDGSTVTNIPAQWQRLTPHLGRIPGQIGSVAYGVVSTMNGRTGFDYLRGVEVSDLQALPAAFRHVHLPAERYAVFTHRGHVSGIRDTATAIYRAGEVEIWFAVK
jgi:AraC family transcriptional regulator